jgi:hypothetical protein
MANFTTITERFPKFLQGILLDLDRNGVSVSVRRPRWSVSVYLVVAATASDVVFLRCERESTTAHTTPVTYRLWRVPRHKIGISDFVWRWQKPTKPDRDTWHLPAVGDESDNSFRTWLLDSFAELTNAREASITSVGNDGPIQRFIDTTLASRRYISFHFIG